MSNLYLLHYLAAILAEFERGVSALLISLHAQTPGLRSVFDCTHPSLPAGDAVRLSGHEFVCTAGHWIPVSNYGSPPVVAPEGF